jgi:hypothetical protein
MTTYPIVSPVDGGVLDPAWGDDVTDAVNDHQTRLSSVETSYNPQVAYTTNGTMATSTVVGTEVAMSAWTGGASPTFVFKAGWVHELTIHGAAADAGTALQAGQVAVRVRKGLNTTSGQQLGYMTVATSGASKVISVTNIRYVKNATASDISTQLGLTVDKQQGGNALIYGDTNIPLMVSMRPIGLISQLTNFAAIAVSIV